MKIDSTLLADVGRMATRPTYQEGDGNVEIPSQYLLALLPLSPVYTMAADGNTIRSASAAVQNTIRVANGGANNTNMVKLGKGIWRIYWNVSYLANFTNAQTSTGLDAYLAIQDPSGTNAIIWSGWAITNSILTAGGVFDLPIDSDGWIIQQTLGSNGVGNAAMIAVGLFCLKVL